LERLLLIALALGRLSELMPLFEEPEIMTLSDIKKLTKKRQRGKRKTRGDSFGGN